MIEKLINKIELTKESGWDGSMSSQKTLAILDPEKQGNILPLDIEVAEVEKGQVSIQDAKKIIESGCEIVATLPFFGESHFYKLDYVKVKSLSQKITPFKEGKTYYYEEENFFVHRADNAMGVNIAFHGHRESLRRMKNFPLYGTFYKESDVLKEINFEYKYVNYEVGEVKNLFDAREWCPKHILLPSDEKKEIGKIVFRFQGYKNPPMFSREDPWYGMKWIVQEKPKTFWLKSQNLDLSELPKKYIYSFQKGKEWKSYWGTLREDTIEIIGQRLDESPYPVSGKFETFDGKTFFIDAKKGDPITPSWMKISSIE